MWTNATAEKGQDLLAGLQIHLAFLQDLLAAVQGHFAALQGRLEAPWALPCGALPGFVPQTPGCGIWEGLCQRALLPEGKNTVALDISNDQLPDDCTVQACTSEVHIDLKANKLLKITNQAEQQYR